jgi:glycerophosphoryl diester phosphodiesterase
MPSPARHPAIVAHRGWHEAFPENSLAAFAAAADRGLPWVECDVWPSSDCLPVVIHDATLQRTTFARGRVDRRRAQDLLALRLRGPGEQTLPSLAQVAALLLRKKTCGLLVEIKPRNHRPLVHAVCQILRPLRLRWMLHSFDPRNLAYARELGDFPLALLVDNRRMLRRAWSAGWQRLHVHQKLLRSAAAHLTSASSVEPRPGDALAVWTVNSPAAWRRVMKSGVDMIITDRPLVGMTV